MNNKKALKSNLFLTLTAFIWGVAFVAQSVGMDYVGPFTFNAVRSIIGGIVLIPVIYFFSDKTKKNDKNLYIGGILCGIVLAFASSLQQIGISLGTTSGKAGFITALYMVIVPFFGVFMKKKIPLKAWIAVVVAVLGMYLLCITEDFKMETGDFVIFLSAILFAVHILIIDTYSPRVDGIKMSCIQFFVCGVSCAVLMFILERPTINAILSAKIPILYAGIMSCGVAYTLQVVFQKNTSPVTASIILSLESVFAVLAGWLILKDSMSLKEISGCILVFIGIIITQIPSKVNTTPKNVSILNDRNI